MLVLSRQIGESIVIGEDIVLTVVNVKGENVRLGITAPRDVPIRRSEVPPRTAPASDPCHARHEALRQADDPRDDAAPVAGS
jgi:carbon storage regulator